MATRPRKVQKVTDQGLHASSLENSPAAAVQTIIQDSSVLAPGILTFLFSAHSYYFRNHVRDWWRALLQARSCGNNNALSGWVTAQAAHDL